MVYYCIKADMIESREILIPQHISKLGVLYSVPVLFTTSYTAFYAGHFMLSIIVYFLYLTSMAHWSCIYKTGTIRDLDIAMVRFTVLYMTFVTTRYMIPEMVNVWYIAVGTVHTVFILNETVLHYGLHRITNPTHRERLMYCVVILHMVCVHYGLPITAIYCSFLTPQKSILLNHVATISPQPQNTSTELSLYVRDL